MRRNGDICHPLHWCMRKLRRVARSRSTAELSAASDASSSLINFQHLLLEITYRHNASMIMDSRALVNLATQLLEPKEAVNKLYLAFIRENFTQLAIRTIAWTTGYYNIADGLTKDNTTSASLIIRALRTGLHPHYPDLMITHAELTFQGDWSQKSDKFDGIGAECVYRLNMDAEDTRVVNEDENDVDIQRESGCND